MYKSAKQPKYLPDPFIMIPLYIPKCMLAKLDKISDKIGMPVSHMAVIALDNELDTVEPFHYPVELPDTPYHEYLYAKEAKAILDFLSKFPQGTSMDNVLLCRRQMGIETREIALEALRELMLKDMVEEFAPNRMHHNQKYNRVRISAEEKKKRQRFRRVEGDSLKYVRSYKGGK